MANITTRKGDTFDLLARRAYGDDQQSALLRSANPGAVEPFEGGVVLTVPDQPTAPKNKPPTVEAADDSELALLINGQRFRFWTGISITRSIDSMDTLNISAPFEPDDVQFRATFKPFAFAPVNINVGGAPLFTGTMLTVDPDLKEDGRTVAAACYSVPAVMGDCTAPASSYPLEWNEAGLKTIAEAAAAPFGLPVLFEADEGATFERVALKPGEKVLPFLIKLAQQRGLLVSSTERGELLFTQSVAPGQPVARLIEGASPLVDVVPVFNPQDYYSEITGIEPVVVGLRGGQVTVRNPRLRGIVRPLAFEVSDTVNADIEAACNAKAGRMFANVVNYSCNVATWRDPSGNIWEPNTTVTIDAPGAMIYGEYEFLVRAVTLSRTSDGGELATLALTIPGAFSSKIPEALPWD
jgi:prophage tail gpP-like protein/phage tail protein X